jgi:saccharopine dehydrogenase-like NADP-dependent oxidoreductase
MRIKKLLLLGGGGVTGKLIIKELLSLSLPVDITVGSRHILQNNSLNDLKAGIKKVAMDLTDEKTTVTQLAQFDLVIITTGPFKTFGNLPHRLCIEAGVDCIDINDEVEVTMDVYALDKAAKERGVQILTGMGLNPGLMTYMSLAVLAKLPAGPKEIFLRLFVGGKQDAGYAAVHVMLDGFHKKVAAIQDGKFMYINARDKSPALTWKFPAIAKPVQVMHCSTPQSFTFAHNSLYRNISYLDFRIHFQGMPLAMVNALRNWSWIKRPSIRNRLANFIFTSQDKMKNRKGNVPESIAVVQAKMPDAMCTACCTGLSSYEMTAKFAAVITELMLAGKITNNKGIMSLEDNIANWQMLSSMLDKRGLNITYY